MITQDILVMFLFAPLIALFIYIVIKIFSHFRL